jgi:hypothetical protein
MFKRSFIVLKCHRHKPLDPIYIFYSYTTTRLTSLEIIEQELLSYQ